MSRGVIKISRRFDCRSDVAYQVCDDYISCNGLQKNFNTVKNIIQYASHNGYCYLMRKHQYY